MLKQFLKSLLNHQTQKADPDKERKKYEMVWKNEEYRHISPGELALENYDLIALLRQHEVKTLLDAGCGSGKLLRRIIERCGDEFEVFGFDIAENCLDSFFDERKEKILKTGCLWDPKDMSGRYDAVVCTDVLEHIPTTKVPDALRNLRNSAKKFCFLGIALFDDYFGSKLVGEPLHLTVKPVDWWVDALCDAGFSNFKTFTEISQTTGKDKWLFVSCSIE